MKKGILLFIVGWFLFLAPIFSAPAPLPRKKVFVKPPFPVGTWKGTWNGGPYTMTFGADSSYKDNVTKFGRYSYDPKTYRLYVDEYSNSMDGTLVISWSVCFNEPLKGFHDNGQPFSLEEINESGTDPVPNP